MTSSNHDILYGWENTPANVLQLHEQFAFPMGNEALWDKTTLEKKDRLPQGLQSNAGDT